MSARERERRADIHLGEDHHWRGGCLEQRGKAKRVLGTAQDSQHGGGPCLQEAVQGCLRRAHSGDAIDCKDTVLLEMSFKESWKMNNQGNNRTVASGF